MCTLTQDTDGQEMGPENVINCNSVERQLTLKMGNRRKRRCRSHENECVPTSLVIKDVQINHGKVPPPTTGSTKLKAGNSKCWPRCGAPEMSHRVEWECRMLKLPGRTYSSFFES